MILPHLFKILDSAHLLRGKFFALSVLHHLVIIVLRIILLVFQLDFLNLTINLFDIILIGCTLIDLN